MDWKHLPEWAHFTLGLAALGFAVLVGTLTRIAMDIQAGNRRKFWSRQLWLDLPALLMMMALAQGAAVYLGLNAEVAGGVGAMFGYIGPRLVDTVLVAFVDKHKGGKS